METPAGPLTSPAPHAADSGAPPEQGRRLRQFRADHPEIEIFLRAAGGPWQTITTEPAGKTVTTRWELDDLLNELEHRIGARQQAQAATSPAGPA
jgi:hypothetical protein